MTLSHDVIDPAAADVAGSVRALALTLEPYSCGRLRLPDDPGDLPLEEWVRAPDDRILRALAVALARTGRSLWIGHPRWAHALASLVQTAFDRCKARGVRWSPLLDSIVHLGLYDEWQDSLAGQHKDTTHLLMARRNQDVPSLDEWLEPVAQWAQGRDEDTADEDAHSWLTVFEAREIWRVVGREVSTLDWRLIAFLWRSAQAAPALLENPSLLPSTRFGLQRLALQGFLNGTQLPPAHEALSATHAHSRRSMAYALAKAATQEPGLAPDVRLALRGVLVEGGHLADAAREILLADGALSHGDLLPLLPRASAAQLARMLAHRGCDDALRTLVLEQAVTSQIDVAALVREFTALGGRGPHIEASLLFLVRAVPPSHKDAWPLMALHAGASQDVWMAMLAHNPPPAVVEAIAAVPTARQTSEIRRDLFTRRSAAVHRWLFRDGRPNEVLRSWRIVADHDPKEAVDLATRFPIPPGAVAHRETVVRLLGHEYAPLRELATLALGGIQVPGGHRAG